MSDVDTYTGEIVSFNEDTGATAQTARLITDLAALSQGRPVDGFYNSLPSGSFVERVAVSQALSGAKAIADTILARPVNLKHVIIQLAEMKNDEQSKAAGRDVYQTVPRVVLIDDEGNAYYGFGGPLFRDVSNLLGMAGRPDSWDEPIVVQVDRDGSGTRKYFTLGILGTLSEYTARTNAKASK